MEKWKNFEEALEMIISRAEMHARWINNRGEGRLKWEKIVKRDIEYLHLSRAEKMKLFNAYVERVNLRAPVKRSKEGPKKPTIAVPTI